MLVYLVGEWRRGPTWVSARPDLEGRHLCSGPARPWKKGIWHISGESGPAKAREQPGISK
jgi:hypothetical protein